MRCHYCGIEEPFPFKCSYCSEYFCSEHRLPENHACPMYAVARPPRSWSSAIEGNYSYSTAIKPGRISRREAFSFLIGSFLVWLIGYEIISSYAIYVPNYTFVLEINSILFVIAFAAHEYAHKLSANLNGIWAEFRLNTFGLILTIISILSPIFKIISPGATVIFSLTDKNTMGKIALWGPLVNIVMSLLMLPIVLSGNSIILPAFYLNSFIIVFNLIPLSILDGKKIFDWNKLVWSASFIYSLAILVVASMLLHVF